MALLMCQVASSPSIEYPCKFHVILCSRTFFLGSINVQKDFFLVKLRHSDVSDSPIFKKSSLASLFSKIDQIKFFSRLVNSCSKLREFAYGSFIFKKIIIICSKKNHHNQDFQKSCIHFKLGALGSTSFK